MNPQMTPMTPIYSDEELEAWGALFCKHELYRRLNTPFARFMRLTPAARRRCLKAALSRPLAKTKPCLPQASPAGGVT